MRGELTFVKVIVRVISTDRMQKIYHSEQYDDLLVFAQNFDQI